MKSLMEALKSARKLEVFIVLAALAALFLMGMGGADREAASDAEARMQRILSSIEGAGRVRVMLSEDGAGRCTGAVVSSSGADDVAVALQLQRAVRALTELELDKIEIVKSGR